MNISKSILNIFANYFNKAWGFVAIYILIPVYIHFLGIESYGVISFYSIVLGVISIVDAGISTSITREFASNGSNNYKYSIFKIVERYFFIGCLTSAFILFFFSKEITQKWLYSTSENYEYEFKLIAIGVSLQLFSAIYFSGLMGLNKQILANSIQFVGNVFKSLGVILYFVLFDSSLEIFFIIQVFVNLLVIFCFNYFLKKSLLKDNVIKLKILFKRLPNRILTYIKGMLIVSLISAINIYSDKIIIGGNFSLKDFGYYSIASNLAQLTVLIGTPLAITFFPYFSKYFNTANNEKLLAVLKSVLLMFNYSILPISVIIIFFTKEVLNLWMSNLASDPKELELVIFLSKNLTIGSVFLAMQLIPFYFFLANGKTIYTIRQGVFQVLLGLPLLYFSVSYFGVKGVPFSWILINLGAAIYLYFILFIYYLKNNIFSVLVQIIIIPVCVAISLGSVFKILTFYYSINIIGLSIVIFLLALIINVFFYNIINNNPKKFDFKYLLDF